MGPGVATPLKMGVVTVNDKQVNRKRSSHLIGLSLHHSAANVAQVSSIATTKIKKPARGHTFNEDTGNSVVLVTNVLFESSI